MQDVFLVESKLRWLLVMVNGEVETRRGKKLRTGDQIEFNGESFVID